MGLTAEVAEHAEKRRRINTTQSHKDKIIIRLNEYRAK